MSALSLSFDNNWKPKYLHIVGACLAAALIITNVFSFKFIDVFGFKFGGGALLFPFCLILGDVITEIYGYKRARQMIVTSLCCFLFYALVSQIMIILPPAADWPHQEIFTTIFSLTPRIFIAGALAYLAGELINSFILSKMKIKDKGKLFYNRALVSTFFGELINSAIFFTIAFGGLFAWSLILTLIINGTILKTIIEAVLLPVTSVIVQKVKAMEGIEHFDEAVDFETKTPYGI